MNVAISGKLHKTIKPMINKTVFAALPSRGDFLRACVPFSSLVAELGFPVKLAIFLECLRASIQSRMFKRSTTRALKTTNVMRE